MKPMLATKTRKHEEESIYSMRPIRTRLAITVASFGAVLAQRYSWPGRRLDARLHQRRVRSNDSLPGQPGCSDLFHRPTATRRRGGPRRRIAGSGRRGVSGAAAQSACVAGHAGRLERGGPGSHDRHYVSPRCAAVGAARSPLSSVIGSLCALGVVYALATARRRGLSTTVLLLAGVTMTRF